MKKKRTGMFKSQDDAKTVWAAIEKHLPHIAQEVVAKHDGAAALRDIISGMRGGL